MRLRRAMIFTKNIERMASFYRDGLGLAPLSAESGKGWLEFEAGGVALALHELPAHIAKEIEITSPPTPREGTPIKLVFEVPDIEIARVHLINHGAVMAEPSAWGSCDGTDPEGNVFQIVGM